MHQFTSLLSIPLLFCAGVVLTDALETVHAKNDLVYKHIEQRQAQPAPGQLDVFQVNEPILTPRGPSDQNGCVYTSVLMEYNFANSYGRPFVGQYTPPPCSFNRVTMNLTVTSQGRQFDRLAIMYLGDVEVFRTSTAEPTQKGIIWTYVKEMQMYNSLWKQPQTLIYDEGNIVDGTYTGLFNTTLTVTFFTVPDSSATADMVLPISTRQGVSSGKSSVFQLPDQNASVAYTFPRNTIRAVVSLSATGQIGEEFWYSNVPSSRVDTFANTTGSLPGGGTFREIQLYIDGRLSGVSWPFPVIFTGGIVPGLWRPIVGIEAFDLRQHEIDITPWLGYLLDGRDHTFSIKVASVLDDGGNKASLIDSVPSYWLVTGTIFLFQGPAGFVTRGTQPIVTSPNVILSTSSSVTRDSASGQNDTLSYETRATRSLTISSIINTPNGPFSASWSQQLSYVNSNRLTSQGQVQYTQQTITGADRAVLDLGSGGSFSRSYKYPLTVNSSYLVSADGSSLALQADLSNGKSVLTTGNPVFPSGLQNFDTTRYSLPTNIKSTSLTVRELRGDQSSLDLRQDNLGSFALYPSLQGTYLDTVQTGTAAYFSSRNGSYTYGTTEQYFSLSGVKASGSQTGGNANIELYKRHVKAVNSSIVLDDQTLLGRGFSVPLTNTAPDTALEQTVAGGIGETGGVRRFLGRGPGRLVG